MSDAFSSKYWQTQISKSCYNRYNRVNTMHALCELKRVDFMFQCGVTLVEN